MNERFVEIATMAGLQPFEDCGPGYVAKMENFARLIVEECIHLCDTTIQDPIPAAVDTWLNGSLQCIEEIKYHFGIKE